MTQTTAQSVLARKAAAGRRVHDARAMSIAKALRLAFAKAGDALYDMGLAVIGVQQGVLDQIDTTALFDEGKLMLLLDGPAGLPGGALIDPSLVHALVQQQTTGHVTEAGEEGRTLTRTDAAMMAPLLEDVIARMCQLLEVEAEIKIFQGFQFGAQVSDKRLIPLSLELAEYHVFTLTLDVESGRRQGQMVLVFPNPDVCPKPAVPSAAVLGDTPSKGLQAAIQNVPTDLNVVLCKMRLPLSEVESWSLDDSLPIEATLLQKTIVQTASGRRIGIGTLGQKSGFRALKMASDKGPYSGPDRRGISALLAEEAEPQIELGVATPPDLPQDMPAPALDLPPIPEDTGVEIGVETGVEIDGMADLGAMADMSEMADLSDDFPDLPPLSFD